MVRARNDGEQFARCGLDRQSGPESFTAAFSDNTPTNKICRRVLLA